MTEKQLFYPLLSVYFSLILGDLQKEKLQIVSIFRFGHKKRGLFQCPPLGRVGEGLQLKVIHGLLPLALLLEVYLPMTNSRVPPAMMSA